MREAFIKLAINDDNTLHDVDIKGKAADLMAMSNMLIKIVSDSTGVSIEKVADYLKFGALFCESNMKKGGNDHDKKC